MNEMFSDDHEKEKIKPGYKPTLQISVAIKKGKENGMESRTVTQTILVKDSHPVQSSFQFNEEEGIFDKNCDKHVKSCPPLEHSSKDKTKTVSDHSTLKGSLGVTKNCGKRKRKNKFDENVDDIELTTTSNLTDEKKKKTLGRKKRLKNNDVVSQVPALLLRDNDETKRVVAARAAAVLCNWADEDDEIQCTPALAPSSLVQNYCKGSNINSDEREEDFSKNAQDCSESNSRNNDEKCQCQLGESAYSLSKNKEYFSVDSRRRLWTLSSVRAKEIPSDDFYVPNLLPKSTPVKTKKPMKQDNGNNKLVDDMNKNESRDVHLDSPLKMSSQSDSLTESQENNIEMLVELINDDDGQLTVNYTESSDDLGETWLPSSGFCVRKDINDVEEKDKEDVDILISELSCMVGNPLLSDVEIIAKNKNKILAHSFMLCARCKTLANFLQSSQSYCKDESGNGLVRVELLDIDVRAVRAVLTYIYTACFVPVLDETLADVKELVLRWNLNINPEKWKVIKDECEKNSEKDVDQCNVGSLDVLLKSLWEGEEDMNGNEETNDKNVFAESFLDEELAGMTIKIYSQCSLEQVESCEKKNDKSSPLKENSLHQKSEKNDKAIFSTKLKILLKAT
ncbi:structure-specific endonuclease subunit SLX4-like [Xenia sp. Carnegie-2017]|uniref:structure-specific endonuclease subunit SLX4-like n=1 Tax=Xenia sp. Carnegie-2017 TaxID=2897299 RepID=UPI001F03BA70|nr:structure-specific endonuclease subunit SLX4-like [Xenia sp. Carnegie-2017]